MTLEAMAVSKGADEEQSAELRDMARRFGIGAALTLPVFVLAMTHMIPFVGRQPWVNGDPSRWLQFALCRTRGLLGGLAILPARLGLRRDTSPQHVHADRHRRWGGIRLYAVAMLLPGIFPSTMRQDGKVAIYFEAAATVVVLVLLGQVLELRARSRTGSAIKALLNLAPHRTTSGAGRRS